MSKHHYSTGVQKTIHLPIVCAWTNRQLSVFSSKPRVASASGLWRLTHPYECGSWRQPHGSVEQRSYFAPKFSTQLNYFAPESMHFCSRFLHPSIRFGPFHPPTRHQTSPLQTRPPRRHAGSCRRSLAVLFFWPSFPESPDRFCPRKKKKTSGACR